MQPVIYAYLDDELESANGRPERDARRYIRAIEASRLGVRVTPLPRVRTYDEMVKWLGDDRARGGIDGVILDLALTNWDARADGATPSPTDGRAHAQLIHTARGGKQVPDSMPIVLWSTATNLRQLYERDVASHALFDLACAKEDIEGGHAGTIARKLQALASGYRAISGVLAADERPPLHRVLGFDERPSFVDPRLLGHFDPEPGRPQDGEVLPPIRTAEYARFVLRELLEAVGPLIDRRVLAARLGVASTCAGLDHLIGELTAARYCGPFADGWPRWWGYLVSTWWASLGGERPLRITPASERLKLLRALFPDVELEQAAGVTGATSECYWAVCLASERPLDPVDGYALATSRQAWHDTSYATEHALLNQEIQRGYVDGLTELVRVRIDPAEQHRLDGAE